jgi:hypothetical protein
MGKTLQAGVVRANITGSVRPVAASSVSSPFS